jgi:hypothetical protein
MKSSKREISIKPLLDSKCKRRLKKTEYLFDAPPPTPFIAVRSWLSFNAIHKVGMFPFIDKEMQ